ncbi:MAG: DEAD/DEAH box helicase family protein [Conexivisphaerales archaeon]
MQEAILTFQMGSIVIKGDVRVPYSEWDERINAYRAKAIYYSEILRYLKESNLPFIDRVQSLPPMPHITAKMNLRGYQHEAIRNWINAGKRGMLVLPTGSGKTVIALKLIEIVNEPTIVIVPTLDLLEQWRHRIQETFGVDVGIYGGGESSVKGITVATYDSAYLRFNELGNRFNFIVFDEVHHLAAESFRIIAETFTARYRIGLTATLEREDMLHLELLRLVGGVVYSVKPKELAGRYLSDYELQRITVELTEEERNEYERNYSIFKDYIIKSGLRFRNPSDYSRFIMMSARDEAGRRALKARNKAVSIAYNSEAKLDALEEILLSNPNEKILIFTQHNELVYRISKRFLIPFITHTTAKEERYNVLKSFREGRYRAIVTSKVLDEGIDVPDASLGIIVSGTGSSREFIQRLGRLLRKSQGKQKAKLIEIVSRETSETGTSWRRKRKVAEA